MTVTLRFGSNDRKDSIDLSICIVNWNTKNLTSQLIESIRNTVKHISYEIFVVDNASTDGSYDHLSKYYKYINIIRNKRNIGYGAALNQALQITTGRYRMILNSDVILLENAAESMVNFLAMESNAGAVGPIVLDRDGTVSYSYGHFPRPWRMILERFLGSIMPKIIAPPPLIVKPSIADDNILEVEYISGACIVVKENIIKKVGLFDESFFAYYEETDWCYRMMKQGLKRYIISEAKIIHYYDASFSQVPDKANDFFNNSKILYLEKHYGIFIKNIFILANFWANIRHKIKQMIIE